MTATQTSDSRRRWFILALIGLAQLMVVLDATIVNIALPSAQQDLGFSDESRQWIVTAYALVVRQPAAARRSHRRPRRAQARLRHRAHRVRRCLRSRRPRRELRRPRRRPRAAGRLRRAARPGGPQPADHHLHDPGGAQQGLRCVRDHRRLRRGRRPDARRRADRVSELALVHVREPRPRGPGRDRRAAAPRPERAPASRRGSTSPARSPRRPACSPWSTASPTPRRRDGARRSRSSRWPPPSPCSPHSSRSSAASSTRCCRCASSLTAVARGAYLAVAIVGAGMFGVFLFLTYYMQQTLGFAPLKTGLAFLPMMAVLMPTAAIGQTRLVPRFGAAPAGDPRHGVRRGRDADAHRRRPSTPTT